MNKNFKLSLVLTIVVSTFSAFGQTEICNNGVDDDGDGLIDCYDRNCSEDSTCDDFFFGNVIECADDIDVTSFAIRLQWGSEDQSATSHASPVVGDLDGNGVPEVVVTNNLRNSVFVLNGATGATLHSYTDLSFAPENTPVLGDIDRDGFGEILIAQNKGRKMILFNHNLQIEWEAEASREQAIGIPGFADFDEDGDVEIYYRNEVVDAATGTVIIDGETGVNWKKAFIHGTLAVDILADNECTDCAGLELISGNELWAINEAAGTRTLVRDMDNDIHTSYPNATDKNYYPKYYQQWDDQWSSASAADYNLDGFIDVILSGALGTSSEEFKGETTIFFWDVHNRKVITFHDPSNNFIRGPGRINIGDVDNDGQLNANFVMNQKLYSLDENFNIHWVLGIDEGSSGFTGCSLFDFDGDGAMEVTYRSEESLLIVDGIGNGDKTTSIRNEIPCVSRTQEEYPIIADVDGDGASEICTTCFTNNNTPFNDYNNTKFSQVRVYESDGESWMPARRVWNQHAYYNVNINDDLTIPREVQDHSRIFSDGACEYANGDPIPYPNRPLNTFINQAPILNDEGCVAFASPDIEFEGVLTVTDASCPDASIDVTYEIKNIGDISVSGNLPISYYAGDPRLNSGATLLDTKVTALENFAPETTVPIQETITGIGGEFELFAVINDNGTSTLPIPVPLPTSTIPECDTENNIQSSPVSFIRFDLVSRKLKDNEKCDDLLPDNGEAEAYYFGTVPGQNGTPSDSIHTEEHGFVFNWYNLGDTINVIHTGSKFPQMAEGQYIVEGYYGATFCYSVLDTITINRVQSEIYVWSYEVAPQTSCENPNGTAFAFAYTQTQNGTFPATNTNPPLDTLEEVDGYSVTWTLEGDLFDNVIATGNLLENKGGPLTYRYTILDQFTGCTGDSTQQITFAANEISSDSINTSVSNITTCSGIGEVAASVGINSDTTNYDFYWYDDGLEQPTYDFRGAIYIVNEPGYYTVEVVDKRTFCTGIDSILVQDESIPPVLTASATQPNTTCGSNPTGIAEVEVNGTTDPSGFDYTWFVGANTLPENEIPDPGNNPAAFGAGSWEMVNLSAGVYTIIGEETATNCTDTTTVTIVDDITDISFTIDADDLTPNTSCGVPNGRIDAGTGVTSASGYTFSLYSGFTVDASHFIESNSTGVFEGLAGGDYTVLAVDLTTDCPADPVTVTINNQPDYPIITTTPTPDEFCINGNGQILVTAQSNTEPGAYTFEIFDGFSFDNEITSISDITVSTGSTGHTFTGLQDGNYRIRVTNNDLNCSAFKDVIIDEVSELPTFTANRLINPNGSCDSASPNGNITIEIDTIPFDPSDYTWEWYQGSTADSNNLLSVITDNVLDSLPAGEYTVVARDNETGCKTVDLTLTVEDYPNEINITTTLITPQTFCSEGNASISASVDGTALNLGCTECVGNDGFSFEWYFGNDTSNPLDDNDVGGNGTLDFNEDNSQANGLIAGDYTVLAREISTQCFSTQTITVNTNFNIPNSDAIATSNTVCDDASPGINFNGTLTVTAVDDNGAIDFASGNFEITLYEGIGTNGLSITQNNGSFTQLKDGPYTVIVNNILSGCSSNQEVYTVGQNLDDFSGDINTSILPQISCNLSNPTGQISADVGGTTSDYTFILLSTGDTITSNIISSSTSVTFDSLSSGSYRLVVTSELSGCAYDTNLNVLPKQVDPIISNQNTSPNLRCTSPNGSLSFDVNAGTGADSRAGANYRADLYEGLNISPSSSPIESETQTGPSASFTFSGLSDGNYIVSVTDLITGCEATSDRFTIAYDGPEIAIDTANLVLFNPSNCFNNGGRIDLSDVIELRDAVATDFVIVTWFVGNDTSDVNNVMNFIGTGTFPYDGSNISQGGTIDSNLGTNTIFADGLILDQIPSVTYTAKIELNNGCIELLTIDVPDNEAPTLDVNITQPDNCNKAGDVHISINPVTGGDLIDNYEFTVHNGTFSVPPRINDDRPYNPDVPAGTVLAYTSFTSSSATISLDPGEYTLVVRRKTLNPLDGCPVGTFSIIITSPPLPVISTPVTTNNTFCGDSQNNGAEYNGSVNVTATYGGNPADFDFTLFAVNGNTYDQINNGATTLNGNPDFNVVFDTNDTNTNGNSDEITITGLGEHTAGSKFAIIAANTTFSACQDTVLFDIFNEPQVISATGTVEDIGDCTPGTGGFRVSSVGPDSMGDYEFTWLDDSAPTGTEITTTDSSKLDYTTEGDYYVIARNTLNGCETRLDFTIEDITEDPVIVITEDAFDTHCDLTTGTGALTASVVATPYVVTEYLFTWYEGDTIDPNKLMLTPATDGDSVIATSYSISADGDAITALPDGMYTVSVTDTAGVNLGCESILLYDLPEIQEIPLLSLSGIEVSPDSLCNAPTSGQFVIDDSDITPGGISDYSITVRRDSLDGTNVGSGTFLPGSPSTLTFNNLEKASYFISAVNNVTGCSIAPLRIEIEDLSRLPMITLERLVPDRNCGVLATNAGEIEVLADGFDHNDSRYTFQWVNMSTGNNVSAEFSGVSDTEASLIGVPSGDYSVRVTKNSTGCVDSATYTVFNESTIPVISQYTTGDNTNCTPLNGTGTFELIQAIYDDQTFENGGSPAIEGLFALEVFRVSDSVSLDRIVNAPYRIDSLVTDDYYAEITHLLSGCVSDPVNFTIEDNQNLPEVFLFLNRADSTCQTGFTPNGTVTAQTDPGVIFQWYFGAVEDIGVSADTLNGDTLANGSVPVGFDQATLSGLAAGIYSVEVTQPSNRCITRKQITIPNVPAEVEIISVNVTSATNCFGNGIIEITEVQKDGVSDNLADYTFSFYTENPANPDASPAFTTNTSTDPEFDSAIGGITYFIVGTHTVFGCTTSVFQTEVLENLEYPVLVLDDFNRQTNCDPENPNGRLTVLADGQPENGDYNFQWYAGMMVSASDSLSTDDYPGATTNSVSRLDSGFFTVEVVNNVTGCSTVETYEMVNDTPDEFALTTSVSSNTNCSNPNGKVAVSVLNPTFDEVNGQPVARNYEFFWYLNLADATPENAINSIFNFQGSFIENLSEGNYYVLALDGSDNFCNSVVERVEVLDEFIRPEFEIETNDVTVCSDPKDGFAEIAIDNLSAVDITWFDDMNNQIGTGFFVDSLDGGEISREYGVTVVNTITQCHKELVFEIYNNSETPGAPSVSVDNARNNCLLINGSAIANVGGVTDNFLFEWFELEDIDNPYAVGSQVNTLDSGTYFVTATNITTGCTSDSTLVNIGFEEIIPEFDISVENSICLRTEDGATNQFTGSAILQFAEFNLPDIIEWTFLETNEIVGRDTRLIDASPGEYQVRVVAENGCEYFRNFTINVTLNIYNGVSSNGDGRNDFFLIDCIDYFPSNNVKIFNRAGQRIYEVNGYDNSSIRFEGVSNVGGGGLVLPSGTYFYIVNLGTGEDPLQGYLELVR